MATKNSINNQTQDITIDPGASGDSKIQLSINGTGEFIIGVDDDASDAFKISQGSALGSNDTFIVTAAGEITKPLQPAFLLVLASQLSNVTGDGTIYDVVWDTEVFDQNGDVSGSTFTAPVTGRYQFDVALTFGGITTSMVNGFIRIDTSNRNYLMASCDWGDLKNSSNEAGLSFSVLADMDASDTVHIDCQLASGTKVADIITNGSTDPYNWFSGHLVC